VRTNDNRTRHEREFGGVVIVGGSAQHCLLRDDRRFTQSDCVDRVALDIIGKTAVSTHYQIPRSPDPAAGVWMCICAYRSPKGTKQDTSPREK
jgi:hypothetical protein